MNAMNAYDLNDRQQDAVISAHDDFGLLVGIHHGTVGMLLRVGLAARGDDGRIRLTPAGRLVAQQAAALQLAKLLSGTVAYTTNRGLASGNVRLVQTEMMSGGPWKVSALIDPIGGGKAVTVPLNRMILPDQRAVRLQVKVLRPLEPAPAA